MMPDICFIFEIHQPYRLKRYVSPIPSLKYYHAYFDEQLNREIIHRASLKCYIPAGKILLEQIKRYANIETSFKINLSISGVFIEQIKKLSPKVLKLFQNLVDTGMVELLGQTYFHSLAGIYEDKSEFIEQIKLHKELMEDVFNYSPTVFENTELIYNNEIGRIVRSMGFKGIITEGAERILGDRSPNYVYKAKNMDLKILLRNYRLSDDIGFRFSAKWWKEYPLTAEKYANWLSMTPGDCIVIFIDFETFGEHHWPETGILEFLKYLPEELVKRKISSFNVSEILDKHNWIDELNIGVWDTVSWADVERDVSAWLGNNMQRKAFEKMKNLGELISMSNDNEVKYIWRLLQISDHFYYMSTKTGGPGLVHSYFSYFNDPLDAYTSYMTVLNDIEAKLREKLYSDKDFQKKYFLRKVKKFQGFDFYKGDGKKLGIRVYSLKEFLDIIRNVEYDSIIFHMVRGDIERWIEDVIGDYILGERIRNIDIENNVRQQLIRVIEDRIKELGVD